MPVRTLSLQTPGGTLPLSETEEEKGGEGWRERENEGERKEEKKVHVDRKGSEVVSFPFYNHMELEPG